MPRLALLAVLLVVSPRAGAAGLDPSGNGPLPVGVTTRTFVDASRARTLVTEIWYPAASEGRDARGRRGRWPLVLVAHGFDGFRTNYEYLTVPLASWGFVVAAPDFPGFNKTDRTNGAPLGDLFGDPPRDLSFLRAALHDPQGPAGELAHAIRGRRAGVAGHSLGGAAVVHAALADPDLIAVVALAPLATAADGQRFMGLVPRRAVLVVEGSADTTPLIDRGPFFMALPAPAVLLRILGGTHSGFTDMDAHLTPAELLRQQELTRRYTVAFFKRYLARAPRFAAFLDPADAAAQGSDAELTVHLR